MGNLKNRKNIKKNSIPQEGVEHCASSNTKIKKCTKKVPYDFFYILEGHPAPLLITKKKKARVVTTVFINADATMILCEIFKSFIRQGI